MNAGPVVDSSEAAQENPWVVPSAWDVLILLPPLLLAQPLA